MQPEYHLNVPCKKYWWWCVCVCDCVTDYFFTKKPLINFFNPKLDLRENVSKVGNTMKRNHVKK